MRTNTDQNNAAAISSTDGTCTVPHIYQILADNILIFNEALANSNDALRIPATAAQQRAPKLAEQFEEVGFTLLHFGNSPNLAEYSALHQRWDLFATFLTATDAHQFVIKRGFMNRIASDVHFHTDSMQTPALVERFSQHEFDLYDFGDREHKARYGAFHRHMYLMVAFRTADEAEQFLSEYCQAEN